MVRWGMFAAGAAVIAGAAFVTGTSIPPKPFAEQPKVEARALAPIGQRTGYFNMAAVMRGYKRAFTSVERLNARKARLEANLIGLRNMYNVLKVEVDTESKKSELEKNYNRGFQVGRDLVILARLIEDDTRSINAIINEQAGEVIVKLHDEIRAMVVEMAREHGLSAMISYPAGVTPDEVNSPAVKELTLKPPAAYPFYLDPSVDYTDELLQRLNAKFAAEPGDK